ncbi:MAG: TRAP transporter small permease [Rhodospirillales bacterium]
MTTLAIHIWSAVLRMSEFLRTAGFILSKLALAGIVLTYSYEVVSRYLFDTPTSFSSDLVTYLLCVVVFTMMPYVTATGSQVAVTVVIDALPEQHRALVMRLIYILGFLACAAMTYFASGETLRQILRNIQMLATHPVPKWWISVWIGIGFALSAIEYLRLAITGKTLPKHDDTTPMAET